MEGTWIVFVIAGATALVGGVSNSRWFFEHRKARPLVRLLGRNGARAMYAALGVVLIVAGMVLRSY